MAVEPAGSGLPLDLRGWLVLSAHLFFLVTSGILVITLYANSNDLFLWFLLFEVCTAVLAFVATVTTDFVETSVAKARRIFRRLQVKGAPPENIRWTCLTLAVLLGFYSSGVLVQNTGGPLHSPFIQFPLTMIVLGALMTDRGWTAFFLALFGLMFAALLLWAGVFFVDVGNVQTDSPETVLFFATAINVLIGVAVSFLSQSDRLEAT